MKKIGLFFFGCFIWCIGLASSHLDGMLIKPDKALWTYAIVPYQIDKTMPLTRQADILKAMALWETETVVRFVLLTRENMAEYPDYVVFQPSEGKRCEASVGRQGGMQAVYLAPRCHVLMIAHEIGHVLGLWHEQARSDRDAYIEVIWENIDETHHHNFINREKEGQNQGTYDYDSIMHYSAHAFSKNGKPTLVPRVEAVHIGQRTHLSAGDIAAVNFLYANELK